MGARVIPRGCSIHRIEIQSGGADVGFRCGPLDATMMARGYIGKGVHSQTYPSRFIRGVREVSLGGAHVSGHGSYVSFNLPGPSNCRIEHAGPGKRIMCVTRLGTASGFGRYRRRRRR